VKSNLEVHETENIFKLITSSGHVAFSDRLVFSSLISLFQGLAVACKKIYLMISNFPRVLYVICFLLSNSPASEFYMPTFRNTLSVPSS